MDFKFLDNEYVTILTALFIGLYGLALARTQIPDYIRNLFSNNIFRVVWLSLLIILNFDKTPHIAIVVALVFVLTLHYINKMEAQENLAYLESFRNRLNTKY